MLYPAELRGHGMRYSGKEGERTIVKMGATDVSLRAVPTEWRLDFHVQGSLRSMRSF